MRVAKAIGRFIDFFYFKPFQKIFSREIFRYAACGGTNMVLDLVWYFVIYHFVVAERYIDLGFVVMSPHVASLIVVFPITFFTGFWLNRNVAFRAVQAKTLPQILRYALTVVGSILLNYLCMKLFVEWCGVWATPSKMLTTLVCAIYSYLAGRYYTFTAIRKSKN